MNYDKNGVPIINRSFSRQVLKQGRIMTRADGEFKLIQCSPSALHDVLNCIDGEKDFAHIEKELQEKYPAEGIPPFLNALLAVHIIEVKDRPSPQPEMAILLIGGGALVLQLEELARDCSIRTQFASIEQYLSCPEDLSTSSDFAVVSPAEANYDQLTKINRCLIKYSLPYLPFYFDGSSMVLGPVIIPGKTACWECLVTHRLNTINEKLPASQHVFASDIGYLQFAFKLDNKFNRAERAYFCEMVLQEAKRFMVDGTKLEFLEHEKHYVASYSAPKQDVVFLPTTACGCCHGLSQNYTQWADGLQPCLKEVQSTQKEKICYTIGGMRSRGDVDAKQFITDAIKRAGLCIDVQRIHTPFDQIVPVFRAQTNVSPNNRTPYYFRNIVSRGKGLTENQAYLSASFEMAERLSASFFGDLPLVEAPYKAVKDVAMDLLPLAASIRNLNTAYEAFSPELPIDWVWAKSLVSGDYKLVPAFMVFLGGTKFKGQFLSVGSSGLSAGATLEDAILQGLFEVIEHDAWVTGQSNRLILPCLDYGTSSNERLKECINMIQSIGYDVITRDYSNDLGFPVFRTWIVNRTDYTHYALNGVGASLSAEIALERSFTEAVQSADIVNETSKTYFGASRSESLAAAKDSAYSLDYFRHKDINSAAPIHTIDDRRLASFESVNEAIKVTIAQLQQKIPNCDVLYVNLTRDILNVPVVRVIITGDIQVLNYPLVCVSPRTYQFGKLTGYSDVNTTYDDLYLGPYPH